MVFLSWVKEMDKTIDAIHPWMTTLPPYLHIFAHRQWYLPLNCWLQTCLHYSSSSRAHGSGPPAGTGDIINDLLCSAVRLPACHPGFKEHGLEKK